ncbi:MAG TPA: TonB family protein [Edaphobacter sp.]|nr:TonB family protein [Edaphobacter sp.]
MRKALLATLILSPVLLHAQANSPAKTELALASGPSTAGVAADRGAIPAKLRISTGVVAPKLVYSTTVSSENIEPWLNVAADNTVTVGMVVDKTGKPTDLKILKSAGPIVDRNVLAAVSQYRFEPGTVSNQAIDFPLNLQINLKNDAR